MIFLFYCLNTSKELNKLYNTIHAAKTNVFELIYKNIRNLLGRIVESLPKTYLSPGK